MLAAGEGVDGRRRGGRRQHDHLTGAVPASRSRPAAVVNGAAAVR